MTGQSIAHYRVLEKLGEGGMGIVYKAEDTKLRRTVALKFLPEREVEHQDRFLREAQAAAALNHPNICTIFEIDEANGFIAMEYVDGPSVRQKIAERPLPLEEALDIAMQACAGLEAAHAKGIVHRDIKPGNLMLTAQGIVKIMDFGLAQATEWSRITKSGMALGTPAYMPPEQALGEGTDPRADIWSLGVVLYEMLTGRAPFQGEVEAAMAYAIVNAEPEPPTALRSGLPVEVDHIAGKALAKKREERYQHIEEMLVDLRAVRSGQGTVAPPRRRSRRLRRTALAGAAIAAAALGAFGLFRFSLEKPIDSLAVLPLVNASGNPDMEYLGDGISESLINSLSRVPALRVMSRNSVYRYKGANTDAQAAGQKLKVRAVLTGRVAQHASGLSISVELIEVSTNRQIWGEQYNRRFQDILAVQEEISTAISQQLRYRLTGDEMKQLTRRYTDNTEAYQLYLQGRYHWNKKTPDGFNKGIEYFQKAIEADANYAPAYAGLAALYNNLANYNFALIRPREAWVKAKTAAERAVQIDGNLAAAHTSLALVEYQWEWNWAKAEQEFKRSLELDPGSASTYEPGPSSTYHWYAHFLMSVGRVEESLRAGRRALELEPLDLANNSHQGWHQVFTRQYARAIEPLKKTIEMDPNFHIGQWYLGLAYEQQGAFPDAIARFQEGVRITRGRPSMIALLGHAYAKAGKREEARAVLRELEVLARQRYVPPYPIAAIHAGLGDKEEALRWLEKAYEERDSWMNYLAVDPRLDGLRADARFGELMRRMNFAQR